MLFLVVAAAALVWVFAVRDRPVVPPGVQAIPPLPSPPPAWAFRDVCFPTDQDLLQDPAVPGVFQPTAAGHVQSALFGSVRTAQLGGRLMPSFHEGVDIAPRQRDRRGQAMDAVKAVADGRVGYVNRVAGNSNYGNYVVLLHEDPLGGVYTLYAHLAEVAAGLQAGVRASKGTVLGRMGHTPTPIIPPSRAHLHFEVGLISNARFDRWFRAQRLKPDHGSFNGWNLLAADPRGFFRAQRGSGAFEFGTYVRAIPVAFELLVSTPQPIDFFARYPALWQGASCAGGWIVLACSENGLPVSGRNATADEVRAAGTRRVVVLKTDPAVMGRNGTRLVVKDGSVWRLGQSGTRWLAILTY
jgi:murein DD-endopeptidase MepM/ murein hydrolase activator NlpD